MIVPNRNYRPNPERCLVIDGKFDDQLISRLTPEILKLQKSRKPITVYIVSSPGGDVAVMESLMRLLKSPHQDSPTPCRIITVVTKRAGSAAADMLCSGDYAVAYPHSIIHYHGGRVYEESALTKERTSLLADFLRWTTDYYAWELAKKIEARFRLRFLISRSKFADIRSANATRPMSDFECFLEIIMGHLSKSGKAVCEAARDRYNRYESLLAEITKARKSKTRRQASVEAKQIKAIIDFELEANKDDPNWNFRFGGLAKVTEDFHILTEYLEGKQDDRLKEWCSTFGRFAISPQEKAAIEATADEQIRSEKIIALVQPIIEPVWSFFVALCHALQEGENPLTATDAYWLGLIDEVWGDPEMRALRLIMEYRDDPPEETQELPAPGTQNAKETTEGQQQKATEAGARTGTPQN